MLRTRQFYLMWFATFTMTIMIGFFIMYQKAFGQIRVHDDHFLALVAMTANVLNGLARLFWGFMLDKMGYKVSPFLRASKSGKLLVINTSASQPSDHWFKSRRLLVHRLMLTGKVSRAETSLVK